MPTEVHCLDSPKFSKLEFMCISFKPACVFVHHVCEVPTEAKGCAQTPGTGVRRNCASPCGCWKPNPPEQLSALLALEPFLQPYEASLFKEMPSSVSFYISSFSKFIYLFVCVCDV